MRLRYLLSFVALAFAAFLLAQPANATAPAAAGNQDQVLALSRASTTAWVVNAPLIVNQAAPVRTRTRVPPRSTATPTATTTPTAVPPTSTATSTPTNLPPTQTPTATATAIPPTNTPVTNPTATNTPDPTNPHGSIAQYDGPQTCIACHAKQADDALHSEHMQWEGKWSEVNTYCTSPEPADYACLSCHASTGKVSNLTPNDVDCLICHSDTYRRSLQPLDIPVTVTDWQGNTKTYWTPQKNAEGNYTMQPRFDLMPEGTTMVQLAQNVHLPTRATCLRCHATAGGGDGVKRGDMSSALVNPAYSSDIHMSPQGANLVCQDCHTVTDHKIAGKGIDLRISEGGPVKACQDCHSAQPHGNKDLDKHTAHVACQTCHIPQFAKDMPTEMSRDWTHPVWNPAACSGQGGWVGEEVKQSNVKPAYDWWNGTSYVYNLPEPIAADPDGTYTMAGANGSVQEANAKIYPLKIHTSVQPRHDATGSMVQYDVLWNFMTGKYEEAAARGVAFMGLSGPYSWVNTRAEQLITHGVSPKDDALRCEACHNNGAQMNLDALGYTLKGPADQVCTQCHGYKDPNKLSYKDMHSKHVESKRYDCTWCHTFSRPECGLKLP